MVELDSEEMFGNPSALKRRLINNIQKEKEKKFNKVSDKQTKINKQLDNLKSKNDIINKHKTDKNPNFLYKADKIIKESVLEAYKEGYFTEDEVIELLSE